MICTLTVVEIEAHSGTKTKDVRNKSLGHLKKVGVTYVNNLCSRNGMQCQSLAELYSWWGCAAVSLTCALGSLCCSL